MVLFGQNVMYHHTIMCALHVLLKGILLNASQIKWNPKFYLLLDYFENFKPN